MKISIFSKLLVSVIIIIVVCCTSGFATNLTRNNAYLVYTTTFFPIDGDMITGRIPEMKVKGNPVVDKDRLKIAERCLPELENTFHWRLNSFPESHYSFVEHSEIDREKCRYAVIVPIDELKDSIISGFWHDVVTIGGHRLSSNSVILVPANDTSYAKGNFQGTIVQYNDKDLPRAVIAWLTEHKAPVFTPNIPNGVPLSAEKHLLPELSVVETYNGNAAIVPSSEISKSVGLDNKRFIETTLGQVQELLFVLFYSLRQFRMSYELDPNGDKQMRWLGYYYGMITGAKNSLLLELKDIKDKIDTLKKEYMGKETIVNNLISWKKFIEIWAFYFYIGTPKFEAKTIVDLMDTVRAKTTDLGRAISYPPEAIGEKITNLSTTSTTSGSSQGQVKLGN